LENLRNQNPDRRWASRGKNQITTTETKHYSTVADHDRLLAIVDEIRLRADSFTELAAICPGCGHRIWQAQAGALVYRGCHCMTYCFPPGHPLYEFNPDSWAAAVARKSLSRPHRESFSAQN
jgi:hypothetical protein